jgi:hypothetical protein
MSNEVETIIFKDAFGKKIREMNANENENMSIDEQIGYSMAVRELLNWNLKLLVDYNNDKIILK